VLLIVIAAGVLRYAVAELQEAAWLPGEGHYAFDLTGSIDPEGAVATGFRAVLNLTPSMTWLELMAWAGYIVITLAAFIWVIRRGKAPAAAPAERLAQPVSA
ncbi:MAG: hypothetical protein RL205_1151, partial [Actinomycetota bacterium]